MNIKKNQFSSFLTVASLLLNKTNRGMLYCATLILLVTLCLYSLQAQAPVPPPPANQQEPKLTENGLVSIETLLLDNFEEADNWTGNMARDWGVIAVQKREGAPQELTQAPGAANNRYSLGAKVTFFKTGKAWFTLSPHRKIEIIGNPKTFSIWVAGRGVPHELFAVIKDYFGNFHKVQLGDKLNFPGWNQIKGQVPMSIIRSKHSQRVFNSNSASGIFLTSLLVDCDLASARGTYYIYLDQLEVESDMYFVRQAEKDNNNDMRDDW